MNKPSKSFLERICTQGVCWALFVYKKLLSPLQSVLRGCFGFSCECRFYPTCSEYAHQCFQKYSFFKASWLSIKRLCRCHPLCSGGHDPIP